MTRLLYNGGTPLSKAGYISTSLGTIPLLIKLYKPYVISDSVIGNASAKGFFLIEGGNT